MYTRTISRRCCLEKRIEKEEATRVKRKLLNYMYH